MSLEFELDEVTRLVINLEKEIGKVPQDSRKAVLELEEELLQVRLGVENQMQNLEDETKQLEDLYATVRGQINHAELTTECHEGMKSLLVCYFPREANKDMLRQAFLPFGIIDSVYLVHKDGKPACFGFVNFRDHSATAAALAAATDDQIELVDKRGVVWRVKAEWTTSSDIPKKPKKKRPTKANRNKENQAATEPKLFPTAQFSYSVSLPNFDARTPLVASHGGVPAKSFQFNVPASPMPSSTSAPYASPE